MQYHAFPYHPPGEAVMDWMPSTDAGGLFEVGTVSNTTLACLDYSLEFISSLGVDCIQAHRRSLQEKLQQELPRLGFEPRTPVESTSPIVTFAKQDTSKTAQKLKAANIDIAVYPHRIRISPSVYNDMADGNRLLEAIT